MAQQRWAQLVFTFEAVRTQGATVAFSLQKLRFYDICVPRGTVSNSSMFSLERSKLSFVCLIFAEIVDGAWPRPPVMRVVL
jgi:hypothetical protein